MQPRARPGNYAGAWPTPRGGPAPPRAPPARSTLSGQGKPVARYRVRPRPGEDDPGVRTLLGEYVEGGMNHGRKFFQKARGPENTVVFLYYWDMRDGADLCGWWFGDQVGGSQVWSRASSHSEAPPRSGWRIPWDGPVTEDLLFCEPLQAAAASAAPASIVEAVAATSKRLEALEADAQEVIESAVENLDAEDVAEAIASEVEALLKQQLLKAQHASKALAEEVARARAKGVPQAGVGGLLRLTPRFRAVQESLKAEVQKAQAKLATLREHAAQEKHTAASEARDAKSLQDGLPQAMDAAAQAEDAVEAVAILAAPFDLDEEPGGDARSLGEIEASAAKAAALLLEARKLVTTRSLAAKRFAPEAGRVALEEYQALQLRLVEASKRLNPFKRFRAEWEQRAATRKSVEELAARLGASELEIERAQLLVSGAGGQLTEEEVASAEDLLRPAGACVQEAEQLVARRERAGPALQAELAGLRERAQKAAAKLQEAKAALAGQKEGLSAQRTLTQAHERMDRAKELLLATQEAELPFLRGIEVLPQLEATQAVEECEAAYAEAAKGVDVASTFVSSMLSEAQEKQVAVEGLQFQLVDELTELEALAVGLRRKLAEFKRATTGRRTQAALQQVVQAVAEAEVQVQALADVARLFSPDSLDEVSAEALRATSEQAAIAEKDAAAACAEARSALGAKQREAKEPALVAELSRLQARLNAAHAEYMKLRRATSNGERVFLSKQVLTEEEEKIKQVEREVANAETLATPLGDKKPTGEQVKAIEAAVVAAQSALSAAVKSIDAQLPAAPAALKAALSKLITRARKAQEKIDAVKDSTRDQRERVMGDSFVEEATRKLLAMEGALEETAEVELPFLKGIEVLPLREAQETVTACQRVLGVCQAALDEARTFIASRTLEVRRFSEAAEKQVLPELQRLTERVNVGGQKLAAFRKDTETRRQSAQLQEAGEKLASLEATMEEAAKASAALAAEDVDEISAEDAKEICRRLHEMQQSSKAKFEDAQLFIAELPVGPQAETLQKQLDDIEANIAESKKAAGEHEEQLVARKLVAEAEELLSEAEAEIQKATETAAPLLVHKGKPLLAEENAFVVAEAIRELIQKDGSTKDALFRKVAGKGGAIGEDALKSFLDKLPERLGREDLTFTSEQKSAIFKAVDVDRDGSIGKGDFDRLFQERFMCVHGVALTDRYDIGTSETIAKLELDDVVEALAAPQLSEGLGVTRLQCKLVEGGRAGWVTMKGNQGTVYLAPFSPYDAFVGVLGRHLDGASASVVKAAEFLRRKGAEPAGRSGAPLSGARSKLSALRPAVTAAKKQVEVLKGKVAEAKREHTKLQEAERLAQQGVRDSKVTVVILKVLDEKVAAMEEAAARLEEAARPLTEGEDVVEFSSPVTTMEAVEKLAAAAAGRVAAAQACAEEHQGAVAGKASGPMLQARQSLAEASGKCKAAEKRIRSAVALAKSACGAAAKLSAARASAALRDVARGRSVSLEALFDELADKGMGHVTDSDVRELLSGLQGLALLPEQLELILQLMDAGAAGIRRQSFLRAFQEFYSCVKPIALTDDFEISTGATLRLLEVGEFLEVLDGPKGDEKLGVSRVLARALSDGACGWVSLRGNQGTPFLKESPKPFYELLEGEKPFAKGEKLELLEGPRREQMGEAQRVKCKASRDGAVGWFTLRSSDGSTSAQATPECYVCMSPIAITDVQDIKACKVLRKLEREEVVLALSELCDERGAGVTRVACRAARDGLEGWVTVRGNAGTVYVEATARRHFQVLREVPLQTQLKSDGAAIVRSLDKDEAVEVLDGPRSETLNAGVRVKCRALSDGTVGWVPMSGSNLRKCAL